MGGHVFVVHGDLTHLACDDWLIPTDRDLTLTDAWLPVLAEDAVRLSEGGVPRLAITAPAEFCDRSTRVMPVPDEVRAEHGDPSPLTHGQAWLLDVGDDPDVDPGWLVDGAREWLHALGRGSTRRARPLRGLPPGGTRGGAPRPGGPARCSVCRWWAPAPAVPPPAATTSSLHSSPRCRSTPPARTSTWRWCSTTSATTPPPRTSVGASATRSGRSPTTRSGQRRPWRAVRRPASWGGSSERGSAAPRGCHCGTS